MLNDVQYLQDKEMTGKMWQRRLEICGIHKVHSLWCYVIYCSLTFLISITEPGEMRNVDETKG